MSREEYMITQDGTEMNISKLARERKQHYGRCNLMKALDKLKNYNINYTLVNQGIKFILEDCKYTYWSKKNRIYKGSVDTGLTLNAFIKQNEDLFRNGENPIIKKTITPNSKAPGKYKDLTWKQVKEVDINYINWMINQTKDIQLKQMLKKLLKK